MKKLISILCIIAIPAIAQQLPQKTTFKMEVANNRPVFKTDTIGKDNNGVWVRVLDYATYYYNLTDSFFLRPIFYVAKEGNIMTTFEITIPKEFKKITEAEIKFNIPPCPSTTYGYEYNPTFFSKMIDSANSFTKDGWTIIYLAIDNREYFEQAYQYCTKNVELKINGLVIAPNQDREKIQYLRYTKMFVDKLSLNP